MSHSWIKAVSIVMLLLAAPRVVGQTILVPTLEKVGDMQNLVVDLGPPFGFTWISGASGVEDRLLQVGNYMYFTTNLGGEFDVGSLARMSLADHSVEVLLSFDNSTGRSSMSSVTLMGDFLYYTTQRGGYGDSGTLNRWNLSTSVNEVLFEMAPASGLLTPPSSIDTGRFSRSTPLVVDNGSGGHFVYYTTSSGGAGFLAGNATGNNAGTLNRFDTTTNTNVVIADLGRALSTDPPGDNLGSQPFGGLVQVGHMAYFTTFTGGTDIGTGRPNGAGALMSLNLTTQEVTRLLSLDIGHTAFPGSDPIYDAASNSLFFGTVGNATNPGALLQYHLGTNTLTVLHTFTQNIDGRAVWGDLLMYDNKLFFLTQQGGANGHGTAGYFDLTTSELTLLADLWQDDTGRSAFAGWALATYNGEDFLYAITRTGGLYNNGAILRISFAVIPEPSTGLLLGLGAGLLWLRRRNRG